MDEKATMILGSGGSYWLETRNAAGQRRSSYCGNLGRAEIVAAWCLSKGIEFRQVGAGGTFRDLRQLSAKQAPEPARQLDLQADLAVT
jgi:hypothetical protein